MGRVHADRVTRRRRAVVIFFALGDRAAKLLDELKTWLARNNTAIMAVLCLIIAVKLIGDAITGFSS